jgi:type IX secretion system PorP/SprF family membrane protein
MKKYILVLISISVAVNLIAQDPHYSQFFMAPQLINPALSGTGNEARLVANFRQQWSNAGTPFRTISLAGDGKIFENESGSFLSTGVTFMSDQSMNGAFKSTYISGALSYHAALFDGHSIGLGFEGCYGSRRIDYSELTFGEQFRSYGFDVNLPTGESALSNMKPFLSIGTGLVYRYKEEFLNIEGGIAAFHINKPQQSFVKDELQHVPVRITAFASGDYVLSDRVILNFNMAYQQQQTQHYFTAGGCAGLDISGGLREKMLFAGGWYRSSDAFFPYLGLVFDNFQFGFSYDVTLSKQNNSSMPPQSIELSMIIRKPHKAEGVIPCPWK